MHWIAQGRVPEPPEPSRRSVSSPAFASWALIGSRLNNSLCSFLVENITESLSQADVAFLGSKYKRSQVPLRRAPRHPRKREAREDQQGAPKRSPCREDGWWGWDAAPPAAAAPHRDRRGHRQRLSAAACSSRPRRGPRGQVPGGLLPRPLSLPSTHSSTHSLGDPFQPLPTPILYPHPPPTSQGVVPSPPQETSPGQVPGEFPSLTLRDSPGPRDWQE